MKATRRKQWSELISFQRASAKLLDATLDMECDVVAEEIEKIHMEYASIIQYHDENSLSSVLFIAYLSAVQYYFKPIRELPTRRGFADFVFIPKKEYAQDYPALIVELKWNKNAQTALNQETSVHDRKSVHLMRKDKKLKIRTATMDDLEMIAAVEAECFPAAEAATKEEFAKRLQHYSDHFWLMFEGEKLIAFVDGFVTDEADLTDEMYEKAELHNEHGAWQMIFGVNTIPACRRHGYAGELICRAIQDAKKQGRKGLVLTCKDRLVPYYAKFGFVNEGVSDSAHGNVVWNQMRLTL